ncbi:hypothetical protein CYLTODRAFT_183552 [Cylindrobasidium torrendii FP15055 ss-10]|uniref:Uncharacterized protein n=1 Tax=Cylindrobasidium torrendii FP15055 ss-10 TaxID=1314674 RepID=A0A0D7AY87_9AGAR|nr:hypothetical protein CYLTODRAFT_183552 [Cylindrobasidium torrendii FP15055 ss-10]
MKNLVETSANIDALQANIGEFEQCPLRAGLQPPSSAVDTLSDLSDLSDEESAVPTPRRPSSPTCCLSPTSNSCTQSPPASQDRLFERTLIRGARKKHRPVVHQASSLSCSNAAPAPSHSQEARPPPRKPKVAGTLSRKIRPLPHVTPVQKQALIQGVEISSSLPLPPPSTSLACPPPPSVLHRAPLPSTSMLPLPSSSLPLPPPLPGFQFVPVTDNDQPSARKKPRTKPKTAEAIAKAKAKKNANRTRRRQRESRFGGLKDSWLKHMYNVRVYMLPNFDITETRVGVGGWRGSSSNVYEPPRTLTAAIAAGFEEFQWDGTTTVVFLDRNRRFIILLRKKDSSATGVARQARMTAKLKEEAGRALLNGRMGQGEFNALRDGLVHNQGTHVPARVYNNKTNQHVLHRIFNDEDFIYEAHQTNIALRMWNPGLHQAMWDVREAISSQPELSHLPWPYEHSAYALTTVNFGPRTVCKTHRDHADFAFLMSVLKAFGPYDYKKGGHILLPTLGLAIQFPQGAEAYFPTARLPHANTEIGPHETRYSVTSYSGGGLFEWCYRGGLSKRGWRKYLAKYEKATEEAELDNARPALFTDRFFLVWA